jgi:hypothetical protein
MLVPHIRPRIMLEADGLYILLYYNILVQYDINAHRLGQVGIFCLEALSHEIPDFIYLCRLSL